MITIGIGELDAARSPDVLVTYALGSCVGICLLDPITKIAGLAHIMLPSSQELSSSKPSFKFADIAIPALITKMESMGANRMRIKAKIAGGAKMFATTGENSMGNIGARNVTSVKMTLLRNRIPIIAEDIGKDYGRTVYFSSDTGLMQVKSALKGENVI
ncbi:MAG: chemotaxis protein CheD [Oscillospiraceae bacterium]